MSNETVEKTTTKAPEPATPPAVTAAVADAVVEKAPPAARANVPVARSPIIRAVEAITRANNKAGGRPTHSRGVFSAYPMSTPKFAKHTQNRRHEFDDTMARMFVPVTSAEYQAFISSFSDPITRSIMKVLSGDNARQGGSGYIDFLLTSAQHSFDERVQVTETLGDSYVAYFFGHAPQTFAYQGVLLNTFQDDWAMNMFRVFRDIGRGTQLARHRKTFKLRYDSMIVTGAMLNFSWSLSADMQMSCPFSFNLLVKSVQIIHGGLSAPTSFATDGLRYDTADGRFAPDVFLRPTASEQAAKMYVNTPKVVQATTAKPLTTDDYYTPVGTTPQMTMAQSVTPVDEEPWENNTNETVNTDPATGKPYPLPPAVDEQQLTAQQTQYSPRAAMARHRNR